METSSANKIVRIIITALFVAVMAGSWDAWWHQAIGRNTFFEPPHILLYSAVLVAIVSGVYGWVKTSEKLLRRIALLLLVIPLSAPLDNLWHSWFGVEDISSPLIVWSPPHLFLIASLIASFYLLLFFVKRDSDTSAERLLGALGIAAILWLLSFLAAPVYPTGPYELIGFWGAGILAFILAATLFAARRHISGFGSATLMIAFFLILFSGQLGEEIAPGVIILPHDHPPAWLTVFSFLAPAAFIDMSESVRAWLRGGIAGILWSGIIFGFSSQFFEPPFQYGINDAMFAVVISFAGGAAAGFLHKFFQNRSLLADNK